MIFSPEYLRHLSSMTILLLIVSIEDTLTTSRLIPCPRTKNRDVFAGKRSESSSPDPKGVSECDVTYLISRDSVSEVRLNKRVSRH